MRTYHTNTLTKAGSALIVVDIQDKLLHAIHDWETVLANSIKMISFAQTLNVPVIVTEQYPKGLGPTNAAVKEKLSSFSPLVKTVFSCFGAPGFQEKLDELDVSALLLVGIEAHICVQQTALEAIARGYKVHVAADAVGSRTVFNKEIGLEKIRQAGGIITSIEIALYEWLERSDSQEFKTILPLIK